MTNKTITLSRELVAEAAIMLKQTGTDDAIAEDLRAALAEPVPPAGGKPDPIIAVLKGHLADGMNPMFSGGDLKHLIGLLEAGTWLQAEVERLTEQLHTRTADLLACGTARKILQAELTKARELLKEADDFLYIMTDPDSYARLAYQHGLEWCRPINELRGRICTAISSQSAPADKGQGEPVAWANWKVGTKSYVPFRTKEEASRSVERSEIAATQLGPYRVVRLYADQPAPVTVVLPERANAISGSHDYQSGYNTCIEDVIRLNGVKP